MVCLSSPSAASPVDYSTEKQLNALFPFLVTTSLCYICRILLSTSLPYLYHNHPPLHINSSTSATQPQHSSRLYLTSRSDSPHYPIAFLINVTFAMLSTLNSQCWFPVLGSNSVSEKDGVFRLLFVNFPKGSRVIYLLLYYNILVRYKHVLYFFFS